MKVLLLSRSDREGGAAKAAYRLYQGLKAMGTDGGMFVQSKMSDAPEILGPATPWEKALAKLQPTADRFPLSFYPQRQDTFYSVAWFPDNLETKVRQFSPDIINLHWINAGFLQIETLAKFQKPIVWTLHDMWPFTGGCHYSQDCDRYTESCGLCPQLFSQNSGDLSRWVWRRKVQAWQDLNLTIVTPSHWLANCARSSSLFKNLPIKVIPNGLDLQVYKPINQQFCKQLLGLSPDKFTLLFTAINATSDRRKGFHLLQGALQTLQKYLPREQVEIAIVGASYLEQDSYFDYPTYCLGKLQDDLSLSLIYGAADVFLAPALEDNLPNTIMEALSCGVPCVGFKVGGIPDLIEHQYNGYLAEPFLTENFGKGIAWILEDQDRMLQLKLQARKTVETSFNQQIQSQNYLSLFETILNRS